MAVTAYFLSITPSFNNSYQSCVFESDYVKHASKQHPLAVNGEGGSVRGGGGDGEDSGSDVESSGGDDLPVNRSGDDTERLA